MKVTFTRTGERRYRVAVEGKGVIASFMEPAAGYDERLPHDLAHFVVEQYLGLDGAVYGRLAAGGHQFQPLADKQPRRGTKLRDKIAAEQRREAEFAERVIDIACRRWKRERYDGPPAKGVTDEDIKSICTEYDAVSSIWSKLGVGQSMTLEWQGKKAKR
ncbi:MAG: hypothetical protein WBO10_10940 [Pyrinomonadaceae bacterium]